MTQAIAARRDGDAFQARLFWLKAAYLLTDDSPIVRVGFESGPKGFDDIWVEYDPMRPPLDQYGQPLSVERFQCKWHVGLGQYSHSDLTKPEFINATSTSLLQRAYEAFLASLADRKRARFKLVTNWRVDPSDALHGLIRNRSHTLNVDDLFAGKTERSATGQVRKVWREHLGIDDAQLRGLVSTLGFCQVSDSLDDLWERLDVACKAFGLKGVPATSSATTYDDTVYQWARQGRQVFDRKTFREACAQEGLLEGAPARSIVFGVKSFEHAFDSLEDRCTKVLDLTPEFDERFIRDTAAWRSVLLPRLQQFLSEAAKMTEARLRLAIDAHTTMAFAAGTVLNTKSGRVVEIEQRSPNREVWAPDDSPPAGWSTWDIENHDLDGQGCDIAVAVGITHDVVPKVRPFVDAKLPGVGLFMVARPNGGPSAGAVVSGAHAYALAESLATSLKAVRDRSPKARDLRIHLFIAAPNGFTFYLGRHVQSLKPVTLYEFDFDAQRDRSYAPSLSIPEVE